MRQLHSYLYKTNYLFIIFVLLGQPTFAAQQDTDHTRIETSDTIKVRNPVTHRLELDLRPSFMLHNVPFLEGDNVAQKPINNAHAAHLKYSFRFNADSDVNQIYKSAYQGIGVGKYAFGNKEELGDPMAFYIFQGALIARFSRLLSLNYEWNFGISSGWKPYNYETNNLNRLVGSKLNAYLNANFYLNWALSKKFDLMTGVHMTHFSNGNTEYPNAGVNAWGAKLGLAYNFNQSAADELPSPTEHKALAPFPRHVSYDVVLFSSWRRKGVQFFDQMVASPHSYLVFGANFSAMYNTGYKFRVGPSLDLVYDGSANVYTEDYIIGTQQEFFKPPVSEQLAMGVSARAEYVMPYFTLGIGLGVNAIHSGGDLKGSYQVFALKTQVTRSSFLHVGYNLKNFNEPNYLMLGVGYRFNNRYPSIFR